MERRPVKPGRGADSDGLAAERRAFASASQWVADIPKMPETTNPVAPFPEVIGLLGNDPNMGRLAAEVALRGGSVMVCGNRSVVFAGIAIAQDRGFVTPLEAEQAWRRVRASDSLGGFDRAGLVFVSEGQNAFRLAAAVRPRTVVCVVRPTGSGPPARPSRPAMPFPFPRRFLRELYEKNRVAMFPDPVTDSDVLVTLAAWLRPLGLTSVVFRWRHNCFPRGLTAATIPHGHTEAPTRPRAAGCINETLRPLYPEAFTALKHANALQLLVATILSAQCTDARVNIVTPALFKTVQDSRKFYRVRHRAGVAHQADRVLQEQGEEHPGLL